MLRDGVVRGPVLGATIDGSIDYNRDELQLRGTLVPLYGANNLLGQLPIVGLFLGGEKEGLVGITYQVVGKPGNPVLRINPISALAPGILRRVFEFPINNGTYDSNNTGSTGVDNNSGNNNYNSYNSNNNSNYNAASYEFGEQDYTGIGTAAPGAGTYNVGYCVQNYGEEALNNNNWANGYVEVVDGVPNTGGVSQDTSRGGD